MSKVKRATGTCLCGAVRITAEAANQHVGACHCSMCRRWGGGPLLAVDCGTDVHIEGGESIGVFDSSPWAERGFCKKCGSHLFYRIKQTQQYMMPVGLFDDAAGFDLHHQVFIDEKPAYYAFANETKDMTGAEVFAMFAPKDPS